MSRSPKKKFEIVCRCNGVNLEQLEQALKSGSKTILELFDDTTAGYGACGGGCRGKLQALIDIYQATGTVPDTCPIPKKIRPPENP